MRRKNLCLLFVLLASQFLVLPAYGVAAVVFDPTVCARLGSEALLLEKQLATLKEQLASVKGLNPSQFHWSSTKGLLNRMGASIEAAKGLSYSTKNLTSQFNASYPGEVPVNNYDSAYRKRTDQTLGTLNGVLLSLNQSAQHFDQEQAQLHLLQTEERRAVGQTQAIQALSQIASEEVSQLQLLRQTLMAQTTAQNVYFASHVQEAASQRAEFKKMLLAGQIQAPPIGFSGHAIDLLPYRPR